MTIPKEARLDKREPLKEDFAHNQSFFPSFTPLLVLCTGRLLVCSSFVVFVQAFTGLVL